MKRQCKLCGKTNDLFKLTFEDWETDAGEEWSIFVCGSCWETTAAISRRTNANEIKKLRETVDRLVNEIITAEDRFVQLQSEVEALKRDARAAKDPDAGSWGEYQNIKANSGL